MKWNSKVFDTPVRKTLNVMRHSKTFKQCELIRQNKNKD
jgi:hypothetical protein